MGRHRSARVETGFGVAFAAVALMGLVACGGGESPRATVRHARAAHHAVTTTTQSTTTTSTTVATAPPTTIAPAPPTTAPSTPPPPAPEPPPPVETSLADRLVGVGDAGQLISVVAGGDGQTTATFTAYERRDTGWQQVFGPWDARVGYAGFAPPGAKREGDGRTPSGAYGFDFFFGVQSDPGVQFPYRVVTSNAIVWDDDPTSALYNEWVDSSTQDAGADPEPMYNVPAYSYGAVIAYNDGKVPGLGSAIFLHVATGGATAGCVSLPSASLLEVLRWLDPARQPRIVMGTQGDVVS
jgi:L,D-peptidoglycan transpeptidase YkuD (ErfK/YbiS/YcfS/YnhG family)